MVSRLSERVRIVVLGVVGAVAAFFVFGGARTTSSAGDPFDAVPRDSFLVATVNLAELRRSPLHDVLFGKEAHGGEPSADGPVLGAKGLGIGIRHRFAKHHRAFVRHIRAKAHGLGAAATYLGITPAKLRAELRDGKSLAEIAAAHGKSVDGLVDAMLTRVTERLDKAVAKGRLTQQRADEILARLTGAVEKAVQRERNR